jgi:hypothetical protein
MTIEQLSEILAESSDDYHEKITGACKFYMDVDYKTAKDPKDKFIYHDQLKVGENYKKLEQIILKIILKKIHCAFNSADILAKFSVSSSSAPGVISLHIVADAVFEDGKAIKEFLEPIDFEKVKCMIDLNPYKDAGKIQCMRVFNSTKDGRKLIPISYNLNGTDIKSSANLEDHLITYNLGPIQYKKAEIKEVVKEIPKEITVNSAVNYEEIEEILQLFPAEWYDDRDKRLLMMWALAAEDQSSSMEAVAWTFYNKYKSKEILSIKKQQFHDIFWKDFKKDLVKVSWAQLCKNNLKLEELEEIKSKYDPEFKEKQKPGPKTMLSFVQGYFTQYYKDKYQGIYVTCPVCGNPNVGANKVHRHIKTRKCMLDDLRNKYHSVNENA